MLANFHICGIMLLLRAVLNMNGTPRGHMCVRCLMFSLTGPCESSVYECQGVEYAFTSPVRTECGIMFVMYAVLYVHVSCFVVRGCAVSRMFALVMCFVLLICTLTISSSVLCVLMVEDIVCCSECNVVSDECDEPTTCLCDLLVRTVVKLCTFEVCFRGELTFLNCDDICMCAVNKQFELLQFAF